MLSTYHIPEDSSTDFEGLKRQLSNRVFVR